MIRCVINTDGLSHLIGFADKAAELQLDIQLLAWTENWLLLLSCWVG